MFLGFLKIGMRGLGDVAPWTRHVIIEEPCRLTEDDFAAILGMGQVLPGSNTMSAPVLIRDRSHGVAGALLCLLGRMAFSLVVVTALASE